jgi:hypothetical protein
MPVGRTDCPSAAPPPLDREDAWADSGFQKSDDLVDAKRRRLHGRVSPQASSSWCSFVEYPLHLSVRLFIKRASQVAEKLDLEYWPRKAGWDEICLGCDA